MDYLKKYLLNNLREIIEDEGTEGEEDVKAIIEREKERKGKRRRLAWYWLARARFYFFSPIFRDRGRERNRARDSGWRFIGSFREDDLEYIRWLDSRNSELEIRFERLS